MFDRPIESDYAALRTGEVCPKVRSPRTSLDDFFRTHFIEYAYLVLYVPLTGIAMFGVMQNGVAHVWKNVHDSLSIASDKAVP